MPVRHINGINVEYRSEEWDGIDKSGIRVVGKCILVLTDKCVKSAGGIEFDPQKEEQLNAASDTGILVAVAPGAFLLNEDMTPWTGMKPKPGDRVFIEKYAGRQVTGRDGRVYRLMDYGAVGATYETKEVPRGQGYVSCGSDNGGSGKSAIEAIVVTDGVVTARLAGD